MTNNQHTVAICNPATGLWLNGSSSTSTWWGPLPQRWSYPPSSPLKPGPATMSLRWVVRGVVQYSQQGDGTVYYLGQVEGSVDVQPT